MSARTEHPNDPGSRLEPRLILRRQLDVHREREHDIGEDIDEQAEKHHVEASPDVADPPRVSALEPVEPPHETTANDGRRHNEHLAIVPHPSPRCRSYGFLPSLRR